MFDLQLLNIKFYLVIYKSFQTLQKLCYNIYTFHVSHIIVSLSTPSHKKGLPFKKQMSRREMFIPRDNLGKNFSLLEKKCLPFNENKGLPSHKTKAMREMIIPRQGKEATPSWKQKVSLHRN